MMNRVFQLVGVAVSVVTILLATENMVRGIDNLVNKK